MLAVTGPQQYEEVVAAVHEAAPPVPSPFIDLVPEAGLKLTPRHYSYLKISEGCNHRCAFCIIPHLRGDLVSRRPDAILREAEKLVAAGTRELLVISQDTSAYGVDIRHKPWPWKGERSSRPHDRPVARARQARRLGAAPLRLSLPAREQRHPADGRGAGPALPRHSVPARQPEGAAARCAARPMTRRCCERIRNWREQVPDLAIRSSFVVGFPGETDEDVAYLLAWLEEAQLDRVGAFKFEPVEGAPRDDAWTTRCPRTSSRSATRRVMALSARIRAEKLAAKVGSTHRRPDRRGRRRNRRRDRPLEGRRARDRRRGPPARRRRAAARRHRPGAGRGRRRARPFGVPA